MSIFFNSEHIISPGKINLFLSVCSKKDSGYHNINTFFCSISLFDSLFFVFENDNSILISCDHTSVPEDEFNVVYKVVKLFFKFFLIKTKKNNSFLDKFIIPGIKVHIDKNIPVGSGFAGGSGNAAFALLVLNAKFCFPFSNRELAYIGKKVGADIPFFIFSKPVVATGVGNRFYSFLFKLSKFILVIYYGFLISTEKVYKKLDVIDNFRLTKRKKTNKKSCSSESYCFFLNDLEKVIKLKFPNVYKIKYDLFKLGAENVMMSGSGSGIFGIFSDFESIVLAKNFFLKKVGRNYFVRIVRVC